MVQSGRARRKPGVRVTKFDQRIADAQFTMQDIAVIARHHHPLACSEHLLRELDKTAYATQQNQVRNHTLIPTSHRCLFGELIRITSPVPKKNEKHDPQYSHEVPEQRSSTQRPAVPPKFLLGSLQQTL
jgi:hypothetical protein